MKDAIFNLNAITQEVMTFEDTDTEPEYGAWKDIRNHLRFGVLLARLSGTHDVSALRIMGNTELDGSGDNVEIIEKEFEAGQPVTVADMLVLECDTDQIVAAGQAAGKVILSVAAQVTVAVIEMEDPDEFLLTNILSGARYQSEDMTQDVIEPVE